MKDTIDMAREVKATAYTNRHYPDRTTYTFGPEKLEAFANLVRADEREACAKVCDGLHYGLATQRAAEIIRARGDNT